MSTENSAARRVEETDVKASGLRKVVTASMAGTVVEWYEFFLYASAATLVFGKMFFPNSGTELDGIIARALSKDLEARFQSAASFSAALRKVGATLDLRAERKQTDDYLLPVDDEADRVPPMVWLAALGGVAILGTAVWWGWFR